MILSVHQPQYLPWIGYFDKIKKSDAFVFLDNVQYKKREFQNRNKIRTRDGAMWLTVPVVTKDRFFQKISDVGISGDDDWTADHWKSIEWNYAKARFFPVYRDALFAIYQTHPKKLVDINRALIHFFLQAFTISTPVHDESALGITTTSTQRIVDICRALGADTYLSGAGGRDYMDESLFERNNIKLLYQEFKHPVYPQAFEGFEPNLSILDFLLNCGPASWE